MAQSTKLIFRKMRAALRAARQALETMLHEPPPGAKAPIAAPAVFDERQRIRRCRSYLGQAGPPDKNTSAPAVADWGAGADPKTKGLSKTSTTRGMYSPDAGGASRIGGRR